MRWQPMNTAPKEQGAQVLGWFPKVKLDEDDNPTTEVIGGAMAQIERQGDGWTEPEWLGAHGSYFFEDWCFADQPALWHPLPPEPVGPVGVTTCGGSCCDCGKGCSTDGVPAAPAPQPWRGLTKDEIDHEVGELVALGTDFVAPLYAAVEGIERKLRERNGGVPGTSQDQGENHG